MNIVLYNEHAITVQKRKVSVFSIKSLPDAIVIDKTGAFYLSYWEPNQMRGKAARQQKRWRVQERHWRRLADLFSLARCLEEVTITTVQKTIPTIDQLQAECREINVEAAGLSRLSPIARQTIRQRIGEVIDRIKRYRAQPVREADEQLEFSLPLRDSRNRLNEGVVRCRLSTAGDRLLERLKNIEAWLDSYITWCLLTETFFREIETALKRLGLMCGAILKHPMISNGKETGNQRAYLIEKFASHQTWLSHLRLIGGFDRWAAHCADDVVEIKAAIRKGNFAQAKKVITRLVEAVELKQIQFSINEILVQTSSGFIGQDPGTWSAQRDLIAWVRAEVKTIDQTTFRHPIDQPVDHWLEAAEIFLEQVNGHEMPKKAIRQFREALKTAMTFF